MNTCRFVETHQVGNRSSLVIHSPPNVRIEQAEIGFAGAAAHDCPPGASASTWCSAGQTNEFAEIEKSAQVAPRTPSTTKASLGTAVISSLSLVTRLFTTDTYDRAPPKAQPCSLLPPSIGSKKDVICLTPSRTAHPPPP